MLTAGPWNKHWPNHCESLSMSSHCQTTAFNTAVRSPCPLSFPAAGTLETKLWDGMSQYSVRSHVESLSNFLGQGFPAPNHGMVPVHVLLGTRPHSKGWVTGKTKTTPISPSPWRNSSMKRFPGDKKLGDCRSRAITPMISWELH